MKTYLILLLIGLSLVSRAQDKGFVLIGQIVGDDSSRKATLFQWDITRADTTPITNGQFVFTGKVTHPAIGSIGTDKAKQGLGVWLSNDTIRASFKRNGKFLQPIAVSGPSETVDNFNTINQINAYHSSQLSRPQKNQQVADLISQYVRNHPASFYSLHLIAQHSRTLGVDQTRTLLASLSPAMKQLEQVTDIEKQLRNEEATTLEKTLDSFSLPDSSGIQRTVLPGKKPLTLLTFWASWCAPCRHHNQTLVKLYQRIDHNRVELVSISLDNDRGAWLRAIAKDRLTWQQLSDLNFLSGPVAKKLALNAVPQYLLVDSSNKIVAANLDDAINIIDNKK